MQVAAAAESGMVVPLNCFQGLMSAFEVSPAHLQALRQAGFHPEDVRSHYPLAVWRAVLFLSRQHLYPQLTEAEGFREMGRKIVPGLTTASPIGVVVKNSMPNVTVEGMLRRIPTFLAVGRPGLKMDLWAETPNRWRAHVTDVDSVPEFSAGIIDGIFASRKLAVDVRVDRLLPEGYELVFTW